MSATSESNSWCQGGSEGRATRPRWRHRAAGLGSELNLGDASRAAPRAMLLGLAGFLIASGTVAIASMAAADAGWLPAGCSWLHGITLGAILGGSSSIVIMPAVRRMGLSPTLSNLVSLESALTDVLCVVVAAASIRVAVTGSMDLAAAAATLGRAFGIGLGGGLVVGLLALLALKQLRRSTHAYPLLLGMLLVTYVALDELGGSAALGILRCRRARRQRAGPGQRRRARAQRQAGARRGPHARSTGVLREVVLLHLYGRHAGALGAGLGVLLVAARIPVVLIGTLGAGFGRAEKGLVTMFLPRGMAAGVLAILPAQQGMEGAGDMPVVVFATVLTTILLFTLGTSVFRRYLPTGRQEMGATEPSADEAATTPQAG